MNLKLTARLIALPELAWPRLAAACADEEPLPAPAAQIAAVASLSVVATLIGSALTPGRTAGQVVVHTVLAVVGYVGGGLLCAFGVPFVVRAPGAEDLRVRFAAAAALPLVASGVFNIVPLVGLIFLWTLGGAALTARSAWVGASGLLGLEGDRRRHAAVTVTALGTLPIVATTLLRLFFTR